MSTNAPSVTHGFEWTVQNIIRELMTANDWRVSYERRRANVEANSRWTVTQRDDMLHCLARAERQIKDHIATGLIVVEQKRIRWAKGVKPPAPIPSAYVPAPSPGGGDANTLKRKAELPYHPAEAMYPAYGKEGPSSKKSRRSSYVGSKYAPEYSSSYYESTSTPTLPGPSTMQTDTLKSPFGGATATSDVVDGDALVSIITNLQDACTTLARRQQEDDRAHGQRLTKLRDRCDGLEKEVDYLRKLVHRLEDQRRS